MTYCIDINKNNNNNDNEDVNKILIKYILLKKIMKKT